MKLYFPESIYDPTYRWHIFPLIKALENTADHSAVGFEIVANESDSDVVILPMSWNYYSMYEKTEVVLKYYNTLPTYKKVISFVFGDLGCKVPDSFKGLVYRVSGLKSKLPITHKGIPVFIKDPILTYFPKENPYFRSFSTKPVVGFCGQAQSFGFQTIEEVFKRGLKNALSILGIRNQDTDQLIPTTYFRWKVLKRITKSNSINSNFIIRDTYRAGVTVEKETHETTLQFYNNIKHSDYVVCMRGAGNFSTRFYETMAMGRIPVFVNTDCFLPLEDFIDWKQHVVWVNYNERHLIVDKIVAFHTLHNESSLNALFLKNRRLWEDYLQLYPFFKSSHYEN